MKKWIVPIIILVGILIWSIVNADHHVKHSPILKEKLKVEQMNKPAQKATQDFWAFPNIMQQQTQIYNSDLDSARRRLEQIECRRNPKRCK